MQPLSRTSWEGQYLFHHRIFTHDLLKVNCNEMGEIVPEGSCILTLEENLQTTVTTVQLVSRMFACLLLA